MPCRLVTLVILVPALALGCAYGAAAQSQAPSRDQQGSKLRIAIPGDDGSLTPYTFESGYAFMSLVYDTLMWRDAGGVARKWLVRSMRRDPTGRFVNMRLRSGVRWHDGMPLTAQDVAFTYAFMKDRPHPRFTPELLDIQRVEATGRLSLRFALRHRALGLDDQPFADVPILPRHLWQGLPRGRLAPPGMPIGTGPYRLTRYERGRSYRFTANRGYFRGVPSVARIDVPVIRREEAIENELRRRRLDAVPLTVPPGSAPQRLPGVRYSDDVSFNGTMLLFNVRRPPFHRLGARRAVARALNLDRIAGNSAGVAGGTVPAARGMLHPRSRWARAPMRLHEFDPDAARLAFVEEGVRAFRVVAPRNDPVRLATGERVVRALTAVGARAQLVRLSPRALDRALGRHDAPATFDVAVVGIPALASYDPAFLRAMFGDPRYATLNDGGYRSAAFEDIAQRVAAARSARERRSLVADQLRLLARELPAVPLLFGGGTIAYRPRAYDRWVGVRGSGILDKRSLLRGSDTARPQSPVEGAPGDLTDATDNQGFSLVPIIVGFVAIMLVAAGWWLLRGRR